MAIDNITEWD